MFEAIGVIKLERKFSSDEYSLLPYLVSSVL
jgi:hypothetical protein